MKGASLRVVEPHYSDTLQAAILYLGGPSIVPPSSSKVVLYRISSVKPSFYPVFINLRPCSSERRFNAHLVSTRLLSQDLTGSLYSKALTEGKVSVETGNAEALVDDSHVALQRGG